ncbi:MAG: THUMP domain-containing protein [Methanobacteriota archaeon]
MPRAIIVRYGELALKSEPVRRRFEHILIRSMKRTLSGLNYSIRSERGRIFVDTNSTATAVKRLAQVPGITSLSPSVWVKANMPDIRVQALKIAKKELKPGMTFAVRTNRVGKHPFSSRDVNVDLGSSILPIMKNLKVNLSTPEVTISIEIRGENAYVFANTVEGVGGLPVGTQGKVVAILSSNVNDVVAAFMMLKRGCAVFLLFLNSQNNLNGRISKRAVSSAKKLVGFGSSNVLWSFPFKEILATLRKKSSDRAAFYICRRCELRAAEIVAKRVGAEAIVIGDDARLIATQLLANLSATDEACKLAVLRPLSGMSEDDIRRSSEKMGVKFSTGFSPPCPTPAGEIISVEELKTLEKEIKIDTVIDCASKGLKKINKVNK